MMQLPYTAPSELRRYQQSALKAGIAGLVLTILVGLLTQTAAEFFRSYLLAFLFWSSIALGCLAILMLQHLSGGAWGLVTRRFLEAATRTVPLLAILFIPLLVGMRSLYVWADPEAVAADHLLQHKSVYLNVGFFMGRAAVYFGVWLVVAHLLSRWSREQDLTGEPRLRRNLQALSAPGLLLFGATVTFASVDWIMSLDPHWFSTIFGVLFMGGQAVAAMSFVIIALVITASFKPLSGVIAARHYHDLGKLLFAFVMLWAYFSFSQFLIVWSGNLPEEIPWYLNRLSGGWRWLAGALILLHFALPFALLLPRSTNRNPRTLIAIAVLVIVMRYIDLVWLVGPIHHSDGHQPAETGNWAGYLLPIVAVIGLGGIWVWVFLRELASRPLLPIQDPQLEEAIGHG